MKKILIILAIWRFTFTFGYVLPSTVSMSTSEETKALADIQNKIDMSQNQEKSRDVKGNLKTVKDTINEKLLDENNNKKTSNMSERSSLYFNHLFRKPIFNYPHGISLQAPVRSKFTLTTKKNLERDATTTRTTTLAYKEMDKEHVPMTEPAKAVSPDQREYKHGPDVKESGVFFTPNRFNHYNVHSESSNNIIQNLVTSEWDFKSVNPFPRKPCDYLKYRNYDQDYKSDDLTHLFFDNNFFLDDGLKMLEYSLEDDRIVDRVTKKAGDESTHDKRIGVRHSENTIHKKKCKHYKHGMQHNCIHKKQQSKKIYN